MNPHNDNSFDFQLGDNNNYLQKIIEANQLNLVNAYKQQNLGNYEETQRYMEQIHNNFICLGSLVDRFSHTQFIIRENREILSQAHLEKFNSDCPPIRLNKKARNNDYNEKNNVYNNAKPKQLKNKWTEIEQNLFLEGIELFGCKSKIT